MASTYNTDISSSFKVTKFDYFEPSCFEQACSDKVWMKDMNEEIYSIVKNDIWELCELTKNRKCIVCKWIYKIKRNSDGSIVRYKARLVAKGFTKKYGIDYEETFSSIAMQEKIHMVLSFSSHKH